MKTLVTGSAGHLGEALVRTLESSGIDVFGVDIKPSPYTKLVGSIADPNCVAKCMEGVDVVYHTATLHKPHVATHQYQDFIETNITGTLRLLEAAVVAKVRAFIYTSTTSVFGDAMRPPPGAPAVWITEDVKPIPKNIYGVTKTAAEDLCHLFHRKHDLNSIVLRTSRFFPEEDDARSIREKFEDGNSKANEFLFRRVEIEDAVSAHLCAAAKCPELGFGRYIISATTPFQKEDLAELREDAASVLKRCAPEYEACYEKIGWRMFDGIDRVYVNDAARKDLHWQPKYDFEHILDFLERGLDPRSMLAIQIGSKGYHEEAFKDGPYPVS